MHVPSNDPQHEGRENIVIAFMFYLSPFFILHYRVIQILAHVYASPGCEEVDCCVLCACYAHLVLSDILLMVT